MHVNVTGKRYKICYLWSDSEQLDVNILITQYETFENKEVCI